MLQISINGSCSICRFTLAERVLYMPSMGFVILAALLFSKLGLHSNDLSQTFHYYKYVFFLYRAPVHAANSDSSGYAASCCILHQDSGVFICDLICMRPMPQMQHRNGEWVDNETITRAALAVNPLNAILWSNVAHIEYSRGNKELGGTSIYIAFPSTLSSHVF
jgi:hypothetical protein